MAANVRSLEAVEAVRAALAEFAHELTQSLSMIDIEMRRVLDWLEHDRPRYWKSRVLSANDEVAEARAALHRALMYPVADERPSCYEERAALKQAEGRLAYCQEKEERLRHWTREIRHEMFEFEGRISQLNDIVEFDVPQAIGIINKLLARIHDYQAVRTAEGTAALAEALWAAPSPPLPLGEGRGEGALTSPASTTHPAQKPLLPAKVLKLARQLRKTQTDAESWMWSLLRNRQLGGFKFRRQHPVDPYVLDFYCHDELLAIELDGGHHNTQSGHRHDAQRSKLLAAKGIRVLRFWNHEVLQDTEAVLEAIWQALHESQVVRAPSPNPLPKGEGFKEASPQHAADESGSPEDPS